ncbi:MAG: hypothetical protein ACK56B_06875 [Dolichospermum sp.]|jgi:hypothetical protein
MAHVINLKFRSLNEFPVQQGKEYHVSTTLKDLVEANGKSESHLLWKIPLTANVRRPTKNSVIESIIESLKKGISVISSPLHLAADCSKITASLIRLTFKDSDGLLDGGHRLLAFCMAANFKEIDISQVFVNIIIYSGFDEIELKEKAIALNTSKAVSKMSLANYSGDYDWMKPQLEKYRIIYHEGQFGVQTTNVDGCCTIARICSLILALDPSYSPSNTSKKKHPKLSIHAANSIRRDLVPKKLFSLVHDAIDIQSKIFKRLEEQHHSSATGTRFTKSGNDARKYTKLPNHEILTCVITQQSLVFPIISGFRVFVEKTETGDYRLQVSEKTKISLIKKMLTRYFQISMQAKYAGQPLSSIAKDDYVWAEMYDICASLANNETQLSMC